MIEVISIIIFIIKSAGNNGAVMGGLVMLAGIPSAS